MRYLVIGDASSMHVYNFVKTVLIPKNFEIHLLTLSVNPIRPEYLKFYKENTVHTYSLFEKGYSGLKKTDKFHRLLNLIRRFALLSSVPKCDICHVHSLYKTSMLMLYKFRKKFKNTILSYWGSDILVLKPKELALREKCFDFADVITVTVKQSYMDFQKIHGDKYNDKLKISRFATDGLECIHNLSKTLTKDDCKREYGIPTDKICITCGYSAFLEQHQDTSLLEIQKLPQSMREKLFVVIPMQYGTAPDSYKSSVKEILKNSDFDGTVLETFVPFEKSVMLAMATDIYLHLRDTDGFSNALKEHVYAGSEVISGRWLKYIELDEMNAPVTYISNFSQLKDVLYEKIKNYEVPKSIELFEPIYALYSTNNIVNAWQNVIDFAVNTSL